MDKIGCCLRYEVAPQSHLVELRTFPPTTKLHSRYYESDGTSFPQSDERRMKHFDF